ncbi:MAG TPA: hypothetical protein VFI12_01095 [Thermomicrobiales bacterium]|nr:hypothetical protein [Thermomicrobiales bacterium]
MALSVLMVEDNPLNQELARDLLEAAGLAVEYHESDAAHYIDPPAVLSARQWIDETLAQPATR